MTVHECSIVSTQRCTVQLQSSNHTHGSQQTCLQQLPSVKQYAAMPTGSQYCLVRSGFDMHAYRVGDKRVLSRATQHVHSTALHKLLLHQPGRRARAS